MRLDREDTSSFINTFVEEAEAAARLLADRSGLRIEYAHVQNALVSAFALDHSADLLDKNLTRDRIISALETYNFAVFFPTLLAEVTFTKSILPKEVPRSLVEQTVRCHGEVWRVYRNDADPFPSNPHAHNLNSRLKLHLGNGSLFNRRRLVDSISRKDLLAIRRQLADFDLPPLA